jgi:3-phenylpropionate/trans-cinnamate dioxygenase ferredoxin component
MSAEPVGTVASLVPETPVRVTVDGLPVCLVRIGDEVHAIGDICSHADVSLSEGELDVDARLIECWKHGSCFSLIDGHPDSLPATEPVPVYRAWIDGDQVVVDLKEPDRSTS